MKEERSSASQGIILENRKKLTISGMTDVDSFDEKTICLYTQLGELTVQGTGLHIDSMSIDSGDMTISGEDILHIERHEGMHRMANARSPTMTDQ